MTTYCSKWSLAQFLACWEFYIEDLVSALGTGGPLLVFEDPNLVMLLVGSRQQQTGLEEGEQALCEQQQRFSKPCRPACRCAQMCMC